MRARLGHLLAEYANNSDDSTTHQLSITLLDSNAVLMPGESIACQTALAKIMHKYDIEVKHNVVVGRVDSTHVHVKSEGDIIGKVPYTYCIWATGAQGAWIEICYRSRKHHWQLLTISLCSKLMNCHGGSMNNSI
jgi:NADH dehydrogenase FAD-containing subunit